MDIGAADREQKLLELEEKLQQVHARHMARFAELRARQTALLKRVLARLDREQAEKILLSIKGGDEKK